ncbi:MAG: HDOD domain-containing protein [Planctomycetota bacterium]
MKLLLMGANESVTGVLSQTLSRLGIGTKVVSGVEAARRLLSNERVDVVAIDADDHPEDGLVLAQWVRQRRALEKLPLLFLAGRCDAELVRTAAQLGQVDFLMRPFANNILHERLERLVWIGPPQSPGSTPLRSDPPDRDTTRTFSEGVEDFTVRFKSNLHRESLRLFSLLANPLTCAAGARNVAGADPALRDAILSKVNTPEFGLEHEVRQVAEACALLGLRELGQLTLKTSLLEPETPEAVRVAQAWGHGIGVGFLARGFADVLCSSRKDEVGLAGVLSALGLIGLLESRLDGYDQVGEQASIGKESWVNLEQPLLGFDHVEVGASLAEQLGAPSSIVDAIADSTAPNDRQSIASWCVTTASAVTQRYHSRFPMHPDPDERVRQCALARPDAWRRVATILPDLLQSIQAQQEVFNS